MDSHMNWLIVGVLIGSICHTPTALCLIGAWMIVRNQALPGLLGGKCPQELLFDGWMVSLAYLKILFTRRAQDPVQPPAPAYSGKGAVYQTEMMTPMHQDQMHRAATAPQSRVGTSQAMPPISAPVTGLSFSFPANPAHSSLS